MALENAPAAADLLQQTTSTQSNVIVPATTTTSSSVPTGVILPYAAAAAPSSDWLICDGSAVSRTTYATLFGVIGTLYGTGDGSTTFNLPDLRGRVISGYAVSGGHTDVSTLGNNDGASAANRRPKHQHSVYDPGHTHSVNSLATGSTELTGNITPRLSTNGAVAASSTTGVKVNPEAASSSSSPTDAPAYLVLNHIIKI